MREAGASEGEQKGGFVEGKIGQETGAVDGGLEG
jgi:hypothetical protein